LSIDCNKIIKSIAKSLFSPTIYHTKISVKR
jgi:hypothetical protein